MCDSESPLGSVAAHSLSALPRGLDADRAAEVAHRRNRREHDTVTEDEVITQAVADGFELGERELHGEWMWVWSRGDERWPCFLERRQAVNWMRDRLG